MGYPHGAPGLSEKHQADLPKTGHSRAKTEVVLQSQLHRLDRLTRVLPLKQQHIEKILDARAT